MANFSKEKIQQKIDNLLEQQKQHLINARTHIDDPYIPGVIGISLVEFKIAMRLGGEIKRYKELLYILE